MMYQCAKRLMEIGEISNFHFVEKVHQFLSSGDRSIDSIDEQICFFKKRGVGKGTCLLVH